MFFDSSSFRALEGGIKANWQQQELHLQNLANMDTPGYKAKSMVFDQVMDAAQGRPTGAYKSRVVTDTSDIRLDGNNVDVDKESLELYKAYAQYSLLLDKIKGQFNQYNAVLNSGMK